MFYPSEQEGFGLAGIEAASFGVPFMGLAGTVTAELFPDGNGVVLAKDLTPHSIAEAAIPVLTDSRLASNLGDAARTECTARFWKNTSPPDFGTPAQSTAAGFARKRPCNGARDNGMMNSWGKKITL